MSEKKGCGCGKKNVEQAPPPAEAAPAQENSGPQFRTSEVAKESIKKN
jgi:hypothetical protein